MTTLTNKFIHITCSIPIESPSHDVELAREFIRELATEILRQDGGLVVLVNKDEPNNAIPFDWDMIAVVSDFETTYRTGRTLLRTVRRADYQSMLSESQKVILGRIAQNTVDITIPTYHWTGGAIRECQAGQSSAAIVIGGSRGVEDTADLMQAAGKPVLPLNFHIGGQPAEIGGTRLYQDSLTYPQSYMPKTYDRLLARTDALHIQDDASAIRIAHEITAIMAEELSAPTVTQGSGELPQGALRKPGVVLDIVIKANALYKASKNILGIFSNG